MIEAVLYEDRTGELQGFKIKGHAGYADAGEDIVCAGISALVTAAIEGLDKFLSSPPLVAVVPEEEKQSGDKDYFRVQALLPGSLTVEDRRTAKIILETLEIGLKMAATDYGKYVVLRRCCDGVGKT